MHTQRYKEASRLLNASLKTELVVGGLKTVWFPVINWDILIGCSHSGCGSSGLAVEPVCDLRAGVCAQWACKPCHRSLLHADQATTAQLLQRQGGSVCLCVQRSARKDNAMIKSPIIVILIVIPCYNYCRGRRPRCRWLVACFKLLPLWELAFLKMKTTSPLIPSSSWCKEDVAACAAFPLLVAALCMFAFSLAFLKIMNILGVIYVPSAFCSNTICHCKKLWKALLQFPLD